MTDEQYLYIYKRIKPYLSGTPDPDVYMEDLGKTWLLIKDRSTDPEESRKAFEVICVFRRILDAAYMKGVEL